MGSLTLPADIAARREELERRVGTSFPLDEWAWHQNLGIALPLLRTMLRESLGVQGERLTADERDRLTELLIEVLDEAGLDMPLSENEVLDLATAEPTVDMARRAWLRESCPSRIIGLIAARTADPSLIPLWRNAVEWEEWRAEDARRRLYDEYEDEDE